MLEVYLILFGCIIFWPALSIFIRVIIHFKSQIRQNWSYLLLGLFMLSSVLVYVFNFGIDLTNKNASDWNSVATYFNNLFSPALLLITILLLHKTWKTSKEELAETRKELELTRGIVEKQSDIEEHTFYLKYFSGLISKLNEQLESEINDTLIEEACFNVADLILKSNVSNSLAHLISLKSTKIANRLLTNDLGPHELQRFILKNYCPDKITINEGFVSGYYGLMIENPNIQTIEQLHKYIKFFAGERAASFYINTFSEPNFFRIFNEIQKILYKMGETKFFSIYEGEMNHRIQIGLQLAIEDLIEKRLTKQASYNSRNNKRKQSM